MISLCRRSIAIVFALFIAVLLLAPGAQAQVAQANTMTTIAGGPVANRVTAANTQCPGLPTGVKSVDAVGDGCLATSAFLLGSSSAPDMRGGIVMDQWGTVYYASASGNVIQAINQSTGLITAVAGLGTRCGTSVDIAGDGCPAAGGTVLNAPRGIGIDIYGNLVIPQFNADVISVVCTNQSPICSSANLGKMIPIAGCTTGATSNGTGPAQQTAAGNVLADGVAARVINGTCTNTPGAVSSPGEVGGPRGATADRFGNVYYADTDQSRFRVVLGPLTSTFFTGNNPLYAALQVNPASAYVTPVAGDVYTIVNVAGNNKAGFVTAATVKTAFCVGTSGATALNTSGGGCPFYLSGFAAAPSSGTVAALTVDAAGDMIYTDSNGLLLNVFYVGGTQTDAIGAAAQAKMIAVIEANNGGVVPVAGSIYPIGGGGAGAIGAVPNLGTAIALDNQIMKVNVGLDGNIYVGDNARVDILDMNTGYIHTLASAAGPATAGAFCTGTSGPQSIDVFQSGCPVGKATFGPSTTLGVTADAQGNVYIADGLAADALIRKVLAQGVAPQTMGTVQVQNIAVHIPETTTGTVSGMTAVLTPTPDMTVGAVTCGTQNVNDKSFDCTVPVTMTPSAPGLRSATLTVTVPFTPSGGSATPAVVNVALGGVVTGSALALDNAAASVPAVATAQIDGAITGFTVTNGGSGYTSAPTVTVTNSESAPDIFQATISGGAVTGVSDLSNSGNYFTPATVSFSGGGGSGAAATVQITGSVAHNDITLVSGGSGYTVAPTVTFSGGGGSGAAETATISGGAVTGFTFVSTGGGYTTPPTISFTAPPAVAIPATTSTIFSGLNAPLGVAVDGAGNVYTNTSDNTFTNEGFLEFVQGTGSVTLPGSLPSASGGMAVDQLGDVFIANGSGIEELAVTGAPASAGQPATFTPKTITYTPTTGVENPHGIAVDAAGNLYVSDVQAGSASSIYRLTLTAGVAATQTTVGTGLTDPTSLAVDKSGNVYVSDTGVFKFTPGAAPGSYTKTTVTTTATTPTGVATDAAGNLYVQDSGSKTVIEVPVTGPPTTVLTGLTSPQGIAVDGKGNLYSADASKTSITVVSRNAASFNFGTNEATVYTATITDVGNQASTGTNLLTNTTNFAVTGGTSLPCTLVSNSFTAQAAGNACTFTASLVGSGSGTINDVISYLPTPTIGSATLTGTLQGVAVATTTTISAPTPTSPIFVASSGTEATFSVTVAAQTGTNPPNGTVTVTVDSTTVTNPTLVGSGANGVATVTISGLAAGPHTISATYNTTGSFSGSNSGTATPFTIGQATYSTGWGLTSGSTTPIPVSQAIGTGVLNATNSIPGGYVYSVTPSGGSATIVDASTYLTIGSYALSATFVPTDTVDFPNTTLNGGTINVVKGASIASLGVTQFVVAPTLATGNFTSVNLAIAAMPTTGGSIYIAPGTYTGFVGVNYPNVALRGLGGDATKVILTNEFGAFKAPFLTGQGLGNQGTTSDEGSATLLVIPGTVNSVAYVPTNFYAENLTVNNTWNTDTTNSSTVSETSANGTCATGQAANNNFALYNAQTLCGSQALAIFTSADQSVMNNIYTASLQDTVFSGGEVGFSGSACSGTCTVARQYWWRGKIVGDVDYIFGDSAAVFDHDNIFSAFHGASATGTVTIEAQSKHQLTGGGSDYLSGYVFNHTTFTSQATGMTGLELGRPYGTFSTAVLLNSFIDQTAPAAWIEFSGDTNLPTATYVEYNTSVMTDPIPGNADINGVIYTGTGGNTGTGVTGTRETTSQDPGYSFSTNTLKTQITASQAAQFYPDTFLGNTVSGSALQSGSSATWNATNALMTGVNGFAPATTTASVAAGTVVTLLMRPQTAGGGILPTGTYTLLDGSTTIASGNLDATGEAFFTTSALSSGAHSLTWTYSGDANFTTSTTSTPLALTVTGTVNTTTTLSVNNATTSTFGQALTGSVSVTSNLGTGVPTGTISFFVDSSTTASTTCILSAGTCTFSISGITGGGHTVTATFPANTSFNTSSSSPMSITVNVANLTFGTMSFTPTSEAFGTSQSVLISDTLVYSGSVAPTGAVTYTLNSVSYPANCSGSTSPLTCTATVPAGTVAALPVTGYTVTVAYVGDTNYAAANGTSGTFNVNKANQTINFPTLGSTAFGVAPITLGATTTSGLTIAYTLDSSSTAGAASLSGNTLTVLGVGTIVVDANQSGNGSFNTAPQVQSTLTVTKESQTITFAGPTSPVNFGVSPITLSATTSAGQTVAFTLDPTSTPGAGSLSGNTLTVLSIGSIVIDANQSGNANINAATQVQRTLVVSNGAVLNVTAQNASRIFGTANPTFTASVTGQQGTDTFTASATSLATAASPVVVGGYAITPAVQPVPPASLTNYTVSLHNGTLTVTQATASVTLTQTLPATTGTGTGVSTTFAATVTDASPGSTGTPTGSVQFLDGTNVLGTSPIVGSVATLTTSFSTATTHGITAVYSGDTNFASGAQNTLNEVVVTPTFTGVANPSSLTIARGSTGTSTLTFTPVGNYQGTLTLACNGLPSFVSCQFTPSTIVFTGNNAVQTSVLQVFTLNASAQPGTSTSGLLWIPAGLLAFVVAMRRKKLARGLRPLLMLAIAALALTAMTGCGSNASFVTPTGTTTATITASAVGAGGSPNSSQSISLTITITQ